MTDYVERPGDRELVLLEYGDGFVLQRHSTQVCPVCSDVGKSVLAHAKIARPQSFNGKTGLYCSRCREFFITGRTFKKVVRGGG